MFFSPLGAAAWSFPRSEASPCSRTTAGRPSQSFRGAACCSRIGWPWKKIMDYYDDP